MKLTKIALAAVENIFKKKKFKPDHFGGGSKGGTECSSSNDRKLWQRSVWCCFQIKPVYPDRSVWLSLFTPSSELRLCFGDDIKATVHRPAAVRFSGEELFK